jgi:RNA polymerase sigma-70 factor (ECF subfamily)
VIVTGTSFEECFCQHFPRLVALGQSMTGDPDVSRELAQETFVRLHHHWETVGGYENPGGWLRRVMSNLLIDHHRSRTSERRAVERLANRANRDVPAAGFEGDDWSTLVAALPPRQRLIVTLHYGEDLSVADIADALDLSHNTVKSALSKARETLRARWEQHA